VKKQVKVERKALILKRLRSSSEIPLLFLISKLLLRFIFFCYAFYILLGLEKKFI